MYIQKLILDMLRRGWARLFSAAGEQIPSDRLADHFGSIRHYIRDHVPLGGKVAVRLPYDYYYLLCVYACMESGRVYIPLEPSWPENRIGQIRMSSQLDLIIDQSNLPNVLAWSSEAPLEATPEQPDGESVLYILYTSGSTGEPKGVMIPRRAYENFVHFLDEFYPEVTGEDHLLMVTRFTFDMSLYDMAMLLLREMSFFFSRFPEDVFRIAYEIEEYRITCLNTVPNMVNLLLRDEVYPRSDLSSLRFLTVGGARFPWKMLEDIKIKLSPSLVAYNGYGPTECTVYSNVKRFTRNYDQDSHEGVVAIGRGVANVECVLLDSQGKKITEPYVSGELMLGGTQLMKGYCNDPERTATVFVEVDGKRYYRTGDISFFDGKGDYYVTGRMDETLKRRGYRVNLLDIDSYILRIPGVQNCITLAYPVDKAEHLLITVVIPSPGKALTKQQLGEEMAKVLVEYQIPDIIELAESFPVSNSGKVSRKDLMRHYQPIAEKAASRL